MYVLNLPQNANPKWLPGEVIEVPSQNSVKVKLSDNRIVHRHIDHVRKRYQNNAIPTRSNSDDLFSFPTVPHQPIVPQTRQQERRYPTCIRRPVDRYGL